MMVPQQIVSFKHKQVSVIRWLDKKKCQYIHVLVQVQLSSSICFEYYGEDKTSATQQFVKQFDSFLIA